MTLAGLDTQFSVALGRSVLVGVIVAGVSLGIGWPLGVRIGLASFPMRRFLLALLALPLLLPSFLVAIGLSMLWRGFGGAPVVVWVFACLGVPLVSFPALAATLTLTLTRGQADAARLAGGEQHLFRLALRAAFPLAGLAAALAGALTLADPGPGQIFGWPGAASELLTSFAARYDRALATQQAVALAAVAALLAWPLAWKLAPEVAAGLFARDMNRPSPVFSPATTAWVFGAASLFTLLPLAGLLKPLLAQPWPITRAWSEVIRTGTDTLLYAALAAGIAVVVAFALAWAAGRSSTRRRWLVTAALALLALPPALLALWLIPWSGRATLGFALALRGLPVAILLALRAVGSMPPSWSDAARVHHVPRATFLTRVALPWCALLTIQDLAKSHGGTPVFAGVNFALEPNDRLAVLGASGSGKTTLLRLLAGLDEPTSGVIERAAGLRIGMVFQDLALWPNLTALDNVALALPNAPKSQRLQSARDALASCRVAELASRKPGTLSIGQQQRVALARAIVARPQLLLLDEPFSSLDPLLREQLMAEVRRLVAEICAALVLVTHDPLEALALSQRALVLENGGIAEAGELGSLLAAPRSRLLCQFAAQIEQYRATASQPF